MREKVAIVDKSLIYEHFAAILDKLMEESYFKYYFQTNRFFENVKRIFTKEEKRICDYFKN